VIKPLVAVVGLALAGTGVAAGIYLALPGGSEQEAVPQVQATATAAAGTSTAPALTATPTTSGPTPTPKVLAADTANPQYEEPVLLAPGDPPSFQISVADEQALAEDNARPQFSGTVNGFRVYAQKDYNSDRPKYCEGDTIAKYGAVEFLKFGYLVPGTYAHGPQSASWCPNGSLAAVGAQFYTLYSSYGVTYFSNEKAVPSFASAQYVKAVEVAGHPGVQIGPLDGSTRLAFEFGNGFILIEADNLPPAELQRVTEGISCDGC